MQKKVDYLIVGQGLAGSILALQLLQKNKSFHIYDPSISHSATKVAAGIINPLVLKRLTLAWNVKDFIKYNNNFYPKAEKLMGKKFYFPIPLNKMIVSEDEKKFWKHRYKKPGISNFIDRALNKVSANLKPAKDYYSGKIKHAYWLDTNLFLETLRNKFIKENKLTDSKVNYNLLKSNEYQDISFDKIVFCEGAAATKNPLLKDINIIGNKGNLITINSKEYKSVEIVKKKVFIQPIGGNNYKIGATYDINYTHNEKDDDKKELLEKWLKEITNANYKVVDHEAGIRPTVEDRRPILGRIKNKSNFFVFNGLGSRGCMMAPKLAEELIEYMEHNQALRTVCNIDRYYN